MVDNRIFFDDFIIVSGERYFFSPEDNAIFKINKRNMISLFCRLPDIQRQKYRQYKNITYCKGWFIVSPCNLNNHIYLYNINNHCWKTVELKEEKIRFGYRFWTSIVYKNKVFLLGHGYPGVVEINIDTFEVKYINDWVSVVNDSEYYVKENPYLTEGEVRNGIAFLPLCNTNGVLILNLNTRESKVVFLNTHVYGFNGLSIDEAGRWILVSRSSNEFVVYDKNDVHTYEIYVDEQEEHTNGYVGFHKAIIYKNDIFFFPIHANGIYRSDYEGNYVGKVNSCNVLLECECWKKRRCKDVTATPRLIGDEIFFISCLDYKWYILNILDDKVSNIEYAFDADARNYLWEMDYNNFKKSIKIEDKTINLSFLVECLENISE